jgi:hypothetical protein
MSSAQAPAEAGKGNYFLCFEVALSALMPFSVASLAYNGAGFSPAAYGCATTDTVILTCPG